MSKMKKIYIKPEVVLEQIETADFIQTSNWDTKGEGFEGSSESDLDGTVKPGHGFGDAKQGTFVWDEDF